MNLVEWNKIYEENIRLDQIFIEKYQSDSNLFEKNCIELLVELGEFVNETKAFKYWSVKNPDKTKMLEEYADVITMILTFYRIKNMKIADSRLSLFNDEMLKIVNVLRIINIIYQKVSLLMDNFNEDLIREIFDYTLFLGELLGFKEQEVLDAISKKQKIIDKRLNSNY